MAPYHDQVQTAGHVGGTTCQSVKILYASLTQGLGTTRFLWDNTSAVYSNKIAVIIKYILYLNSTYVLNLLVFQLKIGFGPLVAPSRTLCQPEYNIIFKIKLVCTCYIKTIDGVDRFSY